VSAAEGTPALETSAGPSEPRAASIESTGAADVRPLGIDEYRAAISDLSELILDAVASGASINFLADVTPAEATAWWQAREEDVARGVTSPFVAFIDGRIIGCALLTRSTKANSPHRAEIEKVIVHRSARRQGIASALMRAAEDLARAEDRWLLVLDTVTDSAADALYRSLGWHETGVVPNYAMRPDGRPWPATFFWKDLRTVSDGAD
jgi:ribosomal protein S18 acetylase RimI-like enzyme